MPSEPSLEQVEEVFTAARAHRPESRVAYLEAACAGNDILQRRVEALLFAHDRLGEVLPEPPADWSADTRVGTRIGHYQVVGILGTGGMGRVYEATQDKPNRRVALKVLNAGFASRSMMRRFAQEVEVLGRLEHPAIARIYDAGMFDNRVPWFAMELVDGKPLDAYVEANDLGTRDRLRLLVKVCEAVHHAHQKGVIHRDLKPGNILVDDDQPPVRTQPAGAPW